MYSSSTVSYAIRSPISRSPFPPYFLGLIRNFITVPSFVYILSSEKGIISTPTTKVNSPASTHFPFRPEDRVMARNNNPTPITKMSIMVNDLYILIFTLLFLGIYLKSYFPFSPLGRPLLSFSIQYPAKIPSPSGTPSKVKHMWLSFLPFRR
ncbi:MAG: hypothetical protein BWX72_01078 [Firmicutes bacterium ADurb.Bin080]|nr:MAG: hypothetical protein BWX72_01078 [Firmicutes bacterium ADurb.Bin080]